jgi:hypothetical protein
MSVVKPEHFKCDYVELPVKICGIFDGLLKFLQVHDRIEYMQLHVLLHDDLVKCTRSLMARCRACLF